MLRRRADGERRKRRNETEKEKKRERSKEKEGGGRRKREKRHPVAWWVPRYEGIRAARRGAARRSETK